jgi:biopolymer transport protein ExbD
MRFKNQNNNSDMPTVDLIPMLNVMMAVLAFFVLISMTLTTSNQGVDVQLPNEENEVNQPEENTQIPDLMVVELSPEGEIKVQEEIIASQEQLFAQMETYLAESEEGLVLLNANPQTNYENVMQFLAKMRGVGGDRVSLAIVNNEDNEDDQEQENPDLN